jgi:5-(carboxyamino)imidazole ribonucleotide mutase
MRVGIVMGSQSDAPRMRQAAEALKLFGIETEMLIASAHRTPDRAMEWARTAEERGLEVLIAGAGLSAHLAGVVAALSALPVIGVPLSGGALNGLDSLLSTVNMPKGTPVATVAVDGAFNAGLLAVRILGVKDPSLREQLKKYKKEQAAKVAQQSEALEKEG